MDGAQFISANVCAGVNPLDDIATPQFAPISPVFYDLDGYAKRPVGSDGNPPVPPIALGLGQRFALPTSKLQRAIRAGWQWMGCLVTIELNIAPDTIFNVLHESPGGDVTAGTGGPMSISFEIGRQDTPNAPEDPNSTPPPWGVPYSFPGPDFTGGQNPGITRIYNGFTDDTKDPANPTYNNPTAVPLYVQIGSYPPVDTLGIDSLFVAPIVTIKVGQYTLQTNGAESEQGGPDEAPELILFWNDDMEFSIDWQYLQSGPGNPSAIPPISPIPIEECEGPPPTDSGDNICFLPRLTTIFTLAEDELDENDVTVSDNLPAGDGDNETEWKMRTFSDHAEFFSPVTVTGAGKITITAYYAKRDSISLVPKAS